MCNSYPSTEHERIAKANEMGWHRWGPYLSDRAWSTVREDYSTEGNAWNNFSHDQARMRAFRWGEDGLGGFCDDHQNICFAIALWNEKDPILKERFFGLTNTEGNHGEDVKELYFYLDCTPTSSYARMLYRYPQVAYPYFDLVNKNRGRAGAEWELFDQLKDEYLNNRYFDIVIEYAKIDPQDIICRITARNCGLRAAPLHILPHLWYRNYWSWPKPSPQRPEMKKLSDGHVQTSSQHPYLPQQWWYVQQAEGDFPKLLFTENDTNAFRLGWSSQGGSYFKDGIHAYLVPEELERANNELRRNSQPLDWVNPEEKGSKVAAHFKTILAPGASWRIYARLSPKRQTKPFDQLESVINQRRSEADAFYNAIQPANLNSDERTIHRQALAGLLWSRQFYHYNVNQWLKGDPSFPPPPQQRYKGRNTKWRQFDAADVILMPDGWEYPWFAAWDLAFHCVAQALIDPDSAKKQLLLLMREYYMHPNGQIPAYEWEFGDVNPPVTAWAALQIYRQEKRKSGQGDLLFLERIFHKQLLNFTWWVNRQDLEGDNIFEGGFLGLDNISILDRSALGNGKMEQADATGWVAIFCANMMGMAMELALAHKQYEDLAIKFLDHFIYIARAMVNPQQIDSSFEPLWHAEDRFFYDHLYLSGWQDDIAVRVRSLVGLISLAAVEIFKAEDLARLPKLTAHKDWLLENRRKLLQSVFPLDKPNKDNCFILSIFKEDMLRDVLKVVLDENRLLSPFGLRSLSKEHQENPFSVLIDGKEVSVSYASGEADCNIKGGNSNWRGPIWLPANYFIIQTLRQYHNYFGDDFKVEMRKKDGSRQDLTLLQAATEIRQRVQKLFLANSQGHRPIFGEDPIFDKEDFQDTLLFHEYFDAESGKGLGANHQTGWTALIANLIQEKM